MKSPLLIVALLVSLLAAGCSSPDSRVRKNQAAFDTWAPDVQQKVREGKVDIGFDQEMVMVALGKPDRRASRTTATGQADVWVYFDKSPKFSIGVGMGSMRGSTGVGGGVTVGDSGWSDEEAFRVVFEGGRVTAIETRK
ncbi:MAG TPA: hypothetical protein VEQ65_09235 [Opitutus sp.]|nr:hypothetical protein [Opitutus sp.]